MRIGVVREFGDMLYPYTPIHVAGPSGETEFYPAVIDTGFTGYVALPIDEIHRLGLADTGEESLVFGNTMIESVRTYGAEVIWNDRRYSVAIHATGDVATIGMNLLRGYNLSLDVCDQGSIDVQTLS